MNTYKAGDTIRVKDIGSEIDGAVGTVYLANDNIVCAAFNGDKGLENLLIKPEELYSIELVESGVRKADWLLDEPIYYFLMTVFVLWVVSTIAWFFSLSSTKLGVPLDPGQTDIQAVWLLLNAITWGATMGCLFGYDNHYSEKKVGADGLPLERWTCQICGQETDRPMAMCDEHAINELCSRAGVWYTTNENNSIAPYILQPLVYQDGKQVYTGRYYFRSQQDSDRITSAFNFLSKSMNEQLTPHRYRLASNIALVMTGMGLLFIAAIIQGYKSSVEFERKQAEEQARRDQAERRQRMFEDKGGMNKYGDKPY